MMVKFEENTIGVTINSYRKLKDELVDRYRHRICMIGVQTSDATLGFFIHDEDTDEWVFTGDGFRSDGFGEGGYGYRAAIDLIRDFGLLRHLSIREEVLDIYDYAPNDCREIREAGGFDDVREAVGYHPVNRGTQELLDGFAEENADLIVVTPHVVPREYGGY